MPSIKRAAIAFVIAAMAAPLTAVQSPNPSGPDLQVVMRQVADQSMQEMMKPGVQRPDWNKGGVDLLKRLSDDRDQALLEVDADGSRMIAFMTNKPIASEVPTDWELVTEVGQIEGAQSAALPVEISEVEGGYYSVSRTSYTPNGDAHCSSAPVGARLYRRKGAPDDGLSGEAIALLFRALLERTKSAVVCERYDASGDGFRGSYFFPDGRELPFFNERSGTTTIVTKRSTTEMLKQPAASGQ